MSADGVGAGMSELPVAASASPGVNALAALRADPRQAIQEDSIRCLICGGVFRQLTNTHLRAHGLCAADYKVRFGYNRGRPLMCRRRSASTYADARRRRRAGRAHPAAPDPGRAGAAPPRRAPGRIALEELLTRRESSASATARRRPRRRAVARELIAL